MSKKLCLLVGATLLVFAFVPTLVFAATHPQDSTPTTLYACTVTATGAIDETITPNAVESNVLCPSSDTAITISGQGLKGNPGLSNYTVVNSGYSNAGPGVIESVSCPKGTVTLGGGVELGNLNDNPASYGAYITSSRPATVNGISEWWGSYGGTTTTLRVWAECAKVAL